jgi:hypothetical protein
MTTRDFNITYVIDVQIKTQTKVKIHRTTSTARNVLTETTTKLSEQQS